jgi:hypothetical protein
MVCFDTQLLKFKKRKMAKVEFLNEQSFKEKVFNYELNTGMEI